METLVASVVRTAGMLSILLGKEKKPNSLSQDGPNSHRALAENLCPNLRKGLCRQDFSIPMDRSRVLVFHKITEEGKSVSVTETSSFPVVHTA